MEGKKGIADHANPEGKDNVWHQMHACYVAAAVGGH